MVARSTLKALARLALAALLFTQAALVLAACESAWRAPALAIALADSVGHGGNCHEQEINVNLCLAHCLSEDQSLDKPLLKVPAPSVAPVFFMPVVLVPQQQARTPQRLAVPHAAGPPLRILFQSLLI
jgi:hypothetical protein